MVGRPADPRRLVVEQVARRGRAQAALLRTGRYQSPSGGEVDLSAALEAAVAGTRLYAPEQLPGEPQRREGASPVVEVTSERTQEAAYRLVVEEGERVAWLSFASARRPGGGFLNGAVAQEEDLARCSGLYACLRTQPGYYAANRAEPSLLYTDHMIWAPEVPFFRRRPTWGRRCGATRRPNRRSSARCVGARGGCWRWRARWAPRAAGALLFCASAIWNGVWVTQLQIDDGQDRILSALNTYKARHGVYPQTLAEVSDPLVARAQIVIGWDLRPVRYDPAPDGSAFRVTFACPAFLVARYDSRRPGWVHDD